MTLGAEREEIVDKDFAGRVDFVAQNVKTADFGDPVFKPYVIRDMNGVPVAIIGQAFPYTPIANPRYMVPDWSFGIQDENLQKMVDEARAKGAQVVVVLSHNGMDVDLKMASRVRGIDAILGGHTHDGMPKPVVVRTPAARLWSPTPAPTASSSACSTSTSRAARSPTSATSCCRSSPTCCPPTRRCRR
jgi:sulfur-oxidizing protein SoxB